MDETWVSLNEKRVRIIVPKDWRQAPVAHDAEFQMHITLIACIAADGNAAKSTVILPLKMFPSDLEGPKNAFYWSGSKKGWITTDIYEQWIREVFIPHLQIKRIIYRQPDAPALLWLDGHSTRGSEVANQLLAENNVFLVTIPGHTSHILAPLDNGYFREFKNYLTKFFKKAKSRSVPDVRKALVEAVVDADYHSKSDKIIKAAFRECGLFPWDVSKIINDPSKVTPTKSTEAVSNPTPSRETLSGKILVTPLAYASEMLRMI